MAGTCFLNNKNQHMMKAYPFRTNSVWKGSLILISYFLFAACMQHDESLAPQALQNQDLLEVNSDAQEMGSMMKRTFTAHLTSGKELPSGSIDTGAQGQAIFRLSEDASTVYYKLIVANIENVTVSHIHCGAADQSGAPLVWLYGPGAPVTSQSGVIAEGQFTSDNFIPRTDGGSCPGGSLTFENLIERFRNGTTYVNVHTIEHGGGEIRGQIQ
jgi:hypothetical protein